MQEQVTQEATNLRLTEEEAIAIVSLHAEREQKDGVTTLNDLAETLRISTSEAHSLLQEVRGKLQPVPVEPGPIQGPTVGPRFRRRRLLVLVPPLILLAIVAIVVLRLTALSPNAYVDPVATVASFDATPAMAAPAAEVTNDHSNLPFHPKHVLEFPQGTKCEFELAIRINDYAVHTRPTIGWSESGFPTDMDHMQIRLEDSIFESLEYLGSQASPGKADFYTLAVKTSSGEWMTVDLPNLSKSQGVAESLKTLTGRDELRRQIETELQKHWTIFSP